MAGSAALLVPAISQVANAAYGMFHVLLFGIGSMLGMGALSVVIAVPLAVSARWLTRGLYGSDHDAALARHSLVDAAPAFFPRSLSGYRHPCVRGSQRG
jgi:hypothetical protein